MKFNKMVILVLKWFIYILGGVLILVFISLQAYKAYLKSSTKIKTPNGISSMEKVILGDLEQWVFIRSMDTSNPVLIFLHGWPCEPALGMSSSRNLDKELIKHFTVVHWDQLGAGKSFNNNIPNSSMSMERWVEDCNELINYLRNRFNSQKVFLVGHSGGTILGLKIAQKYPEKIAAYVGIAQILNNHEQQAISYNYILQKATDKGNQKTIDKIKEIGPPPYSNPKKELEKAKYIIKNGNFIRNEVVKNMGIIALSYLSSPEYTIKEGFQTLSGKGLIFTLDARYHEIIKMDLTNEVRSLEVPVYFFQGKYDMITPTSQIEDYYQKLKASHG
ncbi:MAG: hypothetical protein C0597_04735, partial [Marinilabiliales bacterium]